MLPTCTRIVADPLLQRGFNSFSDAIRPWVVNIQGRNWKSKLTRCHATRTLTRRGSRMPRYKSSPDQNVLIFPGPEPALGSRAGVSAPRDWVGSAIPVLSETGLRTPCEVVLSGSYRKEFETLRRTYEEFLDLGCTILSPSSVSITREEDGFVYMQGEETDTPVTIEDRHLQAIQKANFVWLHSPDGYVGPTSALEVGFANAVGIPVYAQQAPTDPIMQSFVRLVDSPASLIESRPQHPEPPAPALKSFQEYYRRAALHRGYAKEGPRDCLLLMVEEIGELARALRKRDKLVRHGSYPASNEGHELADVFLYVVHMANVLGLDLASVVREKEFINLEKFLAK